MGGERGGQPCHRGAGARGEAGGEAAVERPDAVSKGTAVADRRGGVVVVFVVDWPEHRPFVSIRWRVTFLLGGVRYGALVCREFVTQEVASRPRLRATVVLLYVVLEILVGVLDVAVIPC